MYLAQQQSVVPIDQNVFTLMTAVQTSSFRFLLTLFLILTFCGFLACRPQSPERLKELIHELESSDGKVRNAAALEIANYGESGKPAVPPLIHVLQHDQSRGIRTSAALALRKIGTKEAINALDNYKKD